MLRKLQVSWIILLFSRSNLFFAPGFILFLSPFFEQCYTLALSTQSLSASHIAQEQSGRFAAHSFLRPESTEPPVRGYYNELLFPVKNEKWPQVGQKVCGMDMKRHWKKIIVVRKQIWQLQAREEKWWMNKVDSHSRFTQILLKEPQGME